MIKNILKILTSNVVSAALAFLVNLLLIRYLDQSQSGEILAFYSALLILAAFFELGSGNGLIFLYRSGHSLKKLLWNGVVISTIICLTSLLWLDDKLLIVGAVLYSWVRLSLAFLQSQSLFNKYSIINILLNLLRLISTFIIIFALGTEWQKTENFELGFVLAIVTALSVATFLCHSSVDEDIHSERTPVLGSLRNNLKFFVVGFSSVVMMRSEPILIAEFIDNSGVATYVAASNLAMLISLGTNSLITAIMPRVSQNDFDFSELVRIRRILSPWVLIGLIFFFVFGENIVTLVYGDSFKDSVPIFLLLASCFLIGSLFAPLESYVLMKKPEQTVFLKIFQLSIYLGSFFVFYASLGIYAAVLSSLSCRILYWVLIYYFSIRFYRLGV